MAQKAPIFTTLLLLFFSVQCFAQPSTRVDLTQLSSPPDTSVLNYIFTEGDTAFYSPYFDTLKFDASANTEVPSGFLGWSSDDGTLNIGINSDVTLQVGQEMLYHVKNQTGSTIADGKVVQFAGTLGASGRLLIALARADTTSEAKYVMGIATADIANGEDGFVTAFGKVRGIDTDGSACGETWVDGDILYLSASTAGCLTNVEPTAPALKIPIAAVVNAANNGTLFVRPTFFPSLKDVHDVNISGATDGQVLAYNSTSGVWEPSSAAGSGTGWLKDSLSAGDVSIDANQNDFAITDLNLMQFSVDTFQFLNLNSTLLYSNSGFSSFGNHLTNIREGRLLRWQSDSPFKSRNYLAISEPFDYVTINAGFGIDSLGRAQPGVTTSAPHIAGPQGGLDGYIGYSAADSTISVYYNSQWRPLAWRSQISGGGAGTGWLKDSLQAGDVRITQGGTFEIYDPNGLDSIYFHNVDGGGLLLNSDEPKLIGAGVRMLTNNFRLDGSRYTSAGAGEKYFLAVGSDGLVDTVHNAGGTGGVFESVGGVTRSTAANTDDFVFGSSQLDDSGVTAEDTRFFFDKSLSAFYAGTFQNAGVNTRGGYSVAFGLNPAAQGLYSTVLGGSNNIVTGAASVIVNGQNNNVTSTFGFIGAGVSHDNNGNYNFIGNGVDNNATTGTSHAFIGSGADLDITNSSTYSSIASGRQNTIDESDYTLVSGGYLNDVDTSDFAFIAGGLNNNIEGSSNYSAILGGSNNNVRRNTLYSAVLGGAGNETDANYSVASGEESRAELPWSKVHAASSFRIPGDAQDMKLIARGGQTGTTGLSIGLGGSSGNYLTVPENSAWAYKSQCIITVINAGTGNVEKGDSKSQFNVGHIQNIGGTMYHTGTIQNLFNDDDVDMSTSFMSYSADSTNDALRITFTPPQAPAGSATTITWAVCTIDVTQVVWDGL